MYVVLIDESETKNFNWDGVLNSIAGSQINFIPLSIDISINGLSTENRLRSQRTPTPYKIRVNSCKLIDLVIIELTNNFSASILKFPEKFDHPFSHICIFENIFSESHGFITMAVASCIKETRFNLSLYLINEDRRNCSTL